MNFTIHLYTCNVVLNANIRAFNLYSESLKGHNSVYWLQSTSRDKTGRQGRAGRRRGPLPMADSDPMGQHDTALARPSHMQGGLGRMQEGGRGAGGSRCHTYINRSEDTVIKKGETQPPAPGSQCPSAGLTDCSSWWLTWGEQLNRGNCPAAKIVLLTLPLTPGLTQSPFGISRGWSAQPGGAHGPG